MTYTFLERLKAFLEEEVCSGLQLKRPAVDDATDFELVRPVVHIGWPETQLAGEAARQRVPGLVIGLSDDVTDDGEARLLPIWLVAMVHSTGTILPGEQLQVDDTGYRDLWHLVDRTVRAIRNAGQTGEGMTLADPTIRYRPDNERYYDYWVGNIEFSLLAPAGPRAIERDLL